MIYHHKNRASFGFQRVGNFWRFQWIFRGMVYLGRRSYESKIQQKQKNWMTGSRYLNVDHCLIVEKICMLQGSSAQLNCHDRNNFWCIFYIKHHKLSFHWNVNEALAWIIRLPTKNRTILSCFYDIRVSAFEYTYSSIFLGPSYVLGHIARFTDNFIIEQ